MRDLKNQFQINKLQYGNNWLRAGGAALRIIICRCAVGNGILLFHTQNRESLRVEGKNDREKPGSHAPEYGSAGISRLGYING
ncbi:hypothetical protein [Serratia quinivorans]|uniref:hypothetical protein n=1 Tax=Serratia quinivorans TaxID=137545 RepID=UPI003F9E8979